MSSYQCSDCNEIVSLARRAQHEKYWCASIDHDDDDDESTTPLPYQALCHHQLHKITSVTLSNGLQLSFEERSVFSDTTGTGGALWKSEVLLAEYVLQFCGGATSILELGCGAAPCASLAAAAAFNNRRILMTDIPDVCALAEVNIRRNAAAIQEFRNSITLSRNTLDTCPLDWSSSTALPQRVLDLMPYSVILCGDCIWSCQTHDILARTIARLVSTSSSKCVMAFQRRSEQEESFFESTCPTYGLRRVAVKEQDELLAKLPGDGDHEGLEICELVLAVEEDESCVCVM